MSSAINHPINEALSLLNELRNIYASEGGGPFVNGITNIGWLLSDPARTEDQRWHDAAHAYTRLANQKAGFSDFYIDRLNSEQRTQANAKLDEIRDRLWNMFWCPGKGARDNF